MIPSIKLISPALGTLKVLGYSIFRADRSFMRRGPATAGNQNSGGVLTLINSKLSFKQSPSPTSHSVTLPQTISVSESTSRNVPLSSSSTSTPSNQKHATWHPAEHLFPWTSLKLYLHLFPQRLQCPSSCLEFPHISRQCW